MKEIKLSIPEGTYRLNISIEINKDGQAVVTYETPAVEIRKEWKPKDGDFLTNKSYGIVVIYADTKDDGIVSYAGFDGNFLTIEKDRGWGYTKEFRPATEEEKQKLIDRLAQEGLRWNAEEKKLEPIPRWRAKMRDGYYYVSENLSVRYHCENADSIDNSLYESNNYFKTQKAAEKFAEQIRGIFKESKAE